MSTNSQIRAEGICFLQKTPCFCLDSEQKKLHEAFFSALGLDFVGTKKLWRPKPFNRSAFRPGLAMDKTG